MTLLHLSQKQNQLEQFDKIFSTVEIFIKNSNGDREQEGGGDSICESDQFGEGKWCEYESFGRKHYSNHKSEFKSTNADVARKKKVIWTWVLFFGFQLPIQILWEKLHISIINTSPKLFDSNPHSNPIGFAWLVLSIWDSVNIEWIISILYWYRWSNFTFNNKSDVSILIGFTQTNMQWKQEWSFHPSNGSFSEKL